jgi:siroheme synthase-like protein
VFLDLRQRPVTVVGAGRVALRKAQGLLESEARVTVVSPRWLPEFENLPVRLVRRRFRTSDVKGAFLVFTATDDRAVNQSVMRAAKRLGVPVNVADSVDECDFLVPARISHGVVQIAVSTGGTDPRLTVQIRKRIEEALG